MKILILTLMMPLFALARPIRGTYEVPAPEELKAYAIFPVKFQSDQYDNGQKALTFPLPSELTGQQTSLTMAEISPGKWEGDQVSASCSQVGRYFECKMTFRNLPFDTQATTEILRTKYPLEPDFTKALELSALFKSEPAGILRYRLRGGAGE